MTVARVRHKKNAYGLLVGVDEEKIYRVLTHDGEYFLNETHFISIIFSDFTISPAVSL